MRTGLMYPIYHYGTGMRATPHFSVRFDVEVRQYKGSVRSPLPGTKESSLYRGSVHTLAHIVRVRSTLAMLRSIQYSILLHFVTPFWSRLGPSSSRQRIPEPHLMQSSSMPCQMPSELVQTQASRISRMSWRSRTICWHRPMFSPLCPAVRGIRLALMPYEPHQGARTP